MELERQYQELGIFYQMFPLNLNEMHVACCALATISAAAGYGVSRMFVRGVKWYVSRAARHRIRINHRACRTRDLDRKNNSTFALFTLKHVLNSGNPS